VTASAVKIGPRKEIREQIEALDGLTRDDVYNVPLVDRGKSDASLWSKKNRKEPEDPDKASWYRMQWLDLRSLSDTLLWKVGSKDFELAALMRATVSHLRQVHWGSGAVRPADFPPKESIIAAVLLAKKAAQSFYAIARETKTRVESEFPILHSSAASFFRKGHLASINRLLEKVDSGKTLNVRLQWHHKIVWKREASLPEQNLAELCKKIAVTDLSGAYRVLHAERIHADAHFGNLLVDASIPEDPLIISIDPKPLTTTAAQSSLGKQPHSRSTRRV